MVLEVGGIKSKIIRYLQEEYQSKRLPTLNGTPRASEDFFNEWENKGLFPALSLLRERQKWAGSESLPPDLRFVLTVIGSTLLVLSEKDNGNLFTRYLWTVASAILATSWGGGEVEMWGYFGPPETWANQPTHHVQLTSKEYEVVEKNFDPHIDTCYIDTAHRLFPGKFDK